MRGWKSYAAAMLLVQMPLAGATAATKAIPSDITERFLITDLMNRYGVVHDFGSPDEYADLFTADGEIRSASGAVLVKGRDAIRGSAERDHQRFGGVKLPDGKTSSLMRHVVSNPVITSVGDKRATGSSYVMTVVTKGEIGPTIMSVSRYVDEFAKQDGVWRIARRQIVLDFGNGEIAKALGFR
jgi:hypothetical protein